MITARVRTLRIVSPLLRKREDARIEDTQPGDIIEIVDSPVYAVNRVTYQPEVHLQQFLVGDNGVLTPY